MGNIHEEVEGAVVITADFTIYLWPFAHDSRLVVTIVFKLRLPLGCVIWSPCKSYSFHLSWSKESKEERVSYCGIVCFSWRFQRNLWLEWYLFLEKLLQFCTKCTWEVSKSWTSSSKYLSVWSQFRSCETLPNEKTNLQYDKIKLYEHELKTKWTARSCNCFRSWRSCCRIISYLTCAELYNWWIRASFCS